MGPVEGVMVSREGQGVSSGALKIPPSRVQGVSLWSLSGSVMEQGGWAPASQGPVGRPGQGCAGISAASLAAAPQRLVTLLALQASAPWRSAADASAECTGTSSNPPGLRLDQVMPEVDPWKQVQAWVAPR